MKKKFFNIGATTMVAGFIALASSYYMGSVSADTVAAAETQYALFTVGFIIGFILIVASAIFFVLAATRK